MRKLAFFGGRGDPPKKRILPITLIPSPKLLIAGAGGPPQSTPHQLPTRAIRLTSFEWPGSLQASVSHGLRAPCKETETISTDRKAKYRSSIRSNASNKTHMQDPTTSPPLLLS